MPLYEYECRACHHRFEQIQRYSDPLVRKCPKCGKKKVEKLLSAPGVQFKGTGWYITDYQRKGTSSTLPDRDAGSKSDKSEKSSGDKASGSEKGGGEKGGGEKGAAKKSGKGD